MAGCRGRPVAEAGVTHRCHGSKSGGSRFGSIGRFAALDCNSRRPIRQYQIPIVGPDSLAHAQPVQPWEADVQDDGVWILLNDPVHGRVTTSFDSHVESVRRKEIGHHRSERGVVFNEQDAIVL